ncbi:MAG: glycosyltransferase, partial [Clostridia bacterium]|nr:glycosyltransferase [Clostridia bacterium]
AAAILKDIKNLRFHIVGDGSELAKVKALADGLPNVIFYGKKPLEEMPEFYAKADAMLITMKNDGIISYTLPGKVQSYLAAAKPIIGAIGGETERVISDAGCGFCGDSDDAERLAQNVGEFVESKEKGVMAENARKYYDEHFAKDKFFDKLEKGLEE